eukprot:CAMPEP_0197911038 /NCGR_PEP_ID=MMETSP1439-20131203/72048_1 /TAXON_ID=66791 /ORGANISM="Gonyaulax spinifera, Strain CCMP409" /LENGTH=131 /DNA_ID=CAMNT_0043532745 /DNA_START=52 /DNA_END=446 /DNA_ORIENTATION=-
MASGPGSRAPKWEAGADLMPAAAERSLSPFSEMGAKTQSPPSSGAQLEFGRSNGATKAGTPHRGPEKLRHTHKQAWPPGHKACMASSQAADSRPGSRAMTATTGQGQGVQSSAPASAPWHARAHLHCRESR